MLKLVSHLTASDGPSEITEANIERNYTYESQYNKSIHEMGFYMC